MTDSLAESEGGKVNYTLSVSTINPLTEKVSDALGQIFRHLEGNQLQIKEPIATLVSPTKLTAKRITKMETALLAYLKTKDPNVVRVTIKKENTK